MAKKGFLEGYETYNPEKEGYGGSAQWRRTFYKRLTPDERSQILNGRDPYEVLGVSSSDTMEQIKKAYKALMFKHHPDRNPGDPQATHMCQVLNAAYQYFVYKRSK